MARIKFVVLLLIVIVSGAIWFFFDGQDDVVSFSQYREMQKESSMSRQSLAPPAESKSRVQTAALIENFKNNFDQAMALAQETNKRCILAFRKLLPNSKWPEPYGPAYHQMADLQTLLNVGLSPSLAKEDHQVILAMGAELASEGPMPPERVQKLLRSFWELESCRGRDIATLFDAILELARKNRATRKYQDGDVRALLTQLWQALVSAQQGYYTPTDLTFLLGFWQKAQAQGLIGHSYRGELVALAEKIMNELNEDESRLPRSGIPLPSQKLLEFYREVQALGHELEEFAKDVLGLEG